MLDPSSFHNYLKRFEDASLLLFLDRRFTPHTFDLTPSLTLTVLRPTTCEWKLRNMKSNAPIPAIYTQNIFTKYLTVRGGSFSRQNHHFARYNGATPFTTYTGTPARPSPCSPSEIVPSIANIALLTFISFALAEIFNYCGLFQDDDGIKASQQADKFASEHFDSSDDFEGTADRIWNTAQNWWLRNKRSREKLFQLSTWKQKWNYILNLYNIKGFVGLVQCLAFKHQFAIGCTAGMLCQNISLAVISVGFYVYVASEMLYNLREAARDSDEEYYYANENRNTSPFRSGSKESFTNPITSAMNLCTECLEGVRTAVRQSVDRIFQMLEGTDEDFDNGVGTVIVGAVFGVVLKTLLQVPVEL